MITYAQNREDIYIWWLLDGKKDGFYIDIGACDPDLYSVTKMFYEMGWNGINIEPQSTFYKKLVEARPRDINIQTALGDSNGKVKLRIYKDAEGLSTIDDTRKKEIRSTNKFIDEEVDVITLRDLLDRHITKNIHIDFIKIDVEGFEYEVLNGFNWDKYRPKLICIESNHKNKSKDWSNILIKAGYKLVFFDGLNEYYCENSFDTEKAYSSYPEYSLPEHTMDNFTKNKLENEFKEKNKIQINRIKDLSRDLDTLNFKLSELSRENSNQAIELNNLKNKTYGSKIKDIFYETILRIKLKIINILVPSNLNLKEYIDTEDLLNIYNNYDKNIKNEDILKIIEYADHKNNIEQKPKLSAIQKLKLNIYRLIRLLYRLIRRPTKIIISKLINLIKK
jgi:FkbM family methyltransferase